MAKKFIRHDDGDSIIIDGRYRVITTRHRRHMETMVETVQFVDGQPAPRHNEPLEILLTRKGKAA